MMVAVDIAPPAHMVISAVDAPRRSSSCRAVVIKRAPVLPTECPIMLNLDPPLHTKVRAIVSRGFTGSRRSRSATTEARLCRRTTPWARVRVLGDDDAEGSRPPPLRP